MIDWSPPWFDSVRHWGASIDSLARLAQRLDAFGTPAMNANCLPVRFVAASACLDGIAYETRIAATGAVATRDNFHDLFNALIWFAYPRIKSALNALQANALASDGVGARRGSLRDAATLFDENALLVITEDDALINDLIAHRWRDALWTRRLVWHRDVRVVVFGHALLEKLLAPYPAITGHVWRVRAPTSIDSATLDATIAQNLLQSADSLNTRCFTPLPVLGIPGWYAENACGAFYDDVAVFRPKRPNQASMRRATI